MQHYYISKSQEHKATSLINTYTNGGNTRQQVSYADKIKPHNQGGPITQLLDISSLNTALSAKNIHHIANIKCDPKMYRWQGYLIDEIMSKANDKGIYSLDHALTCDLGIQQIQIKSPHDPKWLKSIQSWDIMNYTRNPHDNTYESIASLPIPRNRNILIKGQMIDITDKNSVYSKIRCRTLCIVAQLFTNYSSRTDR